MVDLNKYTFNGWGLSKEAFLELEKLIKNENIKNVLEFGSGQSTYFLKDLEVEFISFDDDKKYSAKVDNVIIRDLISLDDKTFNDVIQNKVSYFEICKNYNTFNIKSTKQRNCFYKLNKKDISKKYQLVILDGPNGNGRSIAFNVIQDKIKYPCYILIDDYDHYPFIEHFNHIFHNNVLIYEYKEKNTNQCFRIYKINK